MRFHNKKLYNNVLLASRIVKSVAGLQQSQQKEILYDLLTSALT